MLYYFTCKNSFNHVNAHHYSEWTKITVFFIFRYYGYRNPSNEMDHRLKVFSHHPYLFENKDILDIGCNIGHITLSVARDFRARSITGIDIDQKLISIARKNIKHYVKTVESPRPDEAQVVRISETKSSEFFPISMPILYGAIDIPGFHDKPKGRGFPNNVTFKQVSVSRRFAIYSMKNNYITGQ